MTGRSTFHENQQVAGGRSSGAYLERFEAEIVELVVAIVDDGAVEAVFIGHDEVINLHVGVRFGIPSTRPRGEGTGSTRTSLVRSGAFLFFLGLM